MGSELDQLSGLMRQLADLVGEFEELAPGRKFTPDGHMVGSIGELIAATEQELTLVTASTEGVDATRKLSDGTCKTVEIKATQRKGFALRHAQPPSDDFIAIVLDFHEGTWNTVYFGPAKPVWDLLPEKTPSNGQTRISVKRLVGLAAEYDYRNVEG